MKEFILFVAAILGVSFNWWVKIWIKSFHVCTVSINSRIKDYNFDASRMAKVTDELSKIRRLYILNTGRNEYKVEIRYLCNKNFELEEGKTMIKRNIGKGSNFEYTFEKRVRTGEYEIPIPEIESNGRVDNVKIEVELKAYISVNELYNKIPISSYVQVENKRERILVEE